MYARYIKRILDLVFALVLLVLLFPVMLIAAVAVKVTSKGTVIFRQERLGKNGKAFWMLKFRSMRMNSEKEGTGVYSHKGDSRVTRVGKLLRATSIDELPQLINIIKGDMSFIGPRPVLTYHPWPFDEYTAEQKKRFSVLPGVTGLAQINGRKEPPWDVRLKFDVAYVENISFLNDFNILFKTAIKVFTNDGNANISQTASSETKESVK